MSCSFFSPQEFAGGSLKRKLVKLLRPSVFSYQENVKQSIESLTEKAEGEGPLPSFTKAEFHSFLNNLRNEWKDLAVKVKQSQEKALTDFLEVNFHYNPILLWCLVIVLPKEASTNTVISTIYQSLLLTS